ncbi:MAG TPA: hypothetical protein VK675_01935 [Candidatus Paceibacterota bacterium]|nr:hypothetical protein [Candidatus Paceibacterota bacterium]
MKNVLAVLLVVCLLPALAEAKDKISIFVNKKTIEIQIGNIGYVSNRETPSKLELVRIWKAPDMLMYNLSAAEVDYSQTDPSIPKPKMTESDVAKKWAEYLKKFKAMREEVKVIVWD